MGIAVTGNLVATFHASSQQGPVSLCHPSQPEESSLHITPVQEFKDGINTGLEPGLQVRPLRHAGHSITIEDVKPLFYVDGQRVHCLFLPPLIRDAQELEAAALIRVNGENSPSRNEPTCHTELS